MNGDADDRHISLLSSPVTDYWFDRSLVRLLRDDDFCTVSEGHCPFCLNQLDAGVCQHCGQRFSLAVQ